MSHDLCPSQAAKTNLHSTLTPHTTNSRHTLSMQSQCNLNYTVGTCAQLACRALSLRAHTQ